MVSIETGNKPDQLFPLAVTLAFIVVTGTLLYIYTHSPEAALPSSLPTGFPVMSGNDVRLAAADVTKETVGYLTSMAFALAAVAAFLVKDGLGAGWRRSWNLVLSSLVTYFVIKSLLFGYDAYGMIATQLSQGHFFISRVQLVLSDQTQNLFFGLISAAGLFLGRGKT